MIWIKVWDFIFICGVNLTRVSIVAHGTKHI